MKMTKNARVVVHKSRFGDHIENDLFRAMSEMAEKSNKMGPDEKKANGEMSAENSEALETASARELRKRELAYAENVYRILCAAAKEAGNRVSGLKNTGRPVSVVGQAIEQVENFGGQTIRLKK